jgi:hypothetical protein
MAPEQKSAAAFRLQGCVCLMQAPKTGCKLASAWCKLRKPIAGLHLPDASCENRLQACICLMQAPKTDCKLASA